MKRFLVCLSIIVIAVCGLFLYDHFVGFDGGDDNSNVKTEGEKYVVSWEAAPSATNYEVYIDGTLIDSVDTTKVDITEYLVNDGTYAIQVKALTVDSGEAVIYQENYKYEAKLKSDFMRKTFFMNGKVYDYNIESMDEYKMFVWYNVLYRNSGVRWYNSCSSINIANVSRITYNYICDYPEYDAVVGRSMYASKVDGNIYRLSNYEYYLPKDFTLSVANATNTTAPKLYDYIHDDSISSNYARTQYKKATIFNREYEKASTSTERTFPIDDPNNTRAVVYNTEQLFMVAQYGATPVFDDSAVVAKTCYENAKTILRTINNSDDLTDYQKALNIYRYICMNVSYDHVLYDFMAYTGDYSVSSNGKYSSFYLEGVLYDLDNQVAVCDGLSKAYALMCRIEGIEATKVNGKADGGEHAWNKIRLGADYYMVDTTWGTVGYRGSGENYEALSHKYFLIGEDDMTDHKSSFEVKTPKTISFDYYSTQKIGTVSAVITSDEDFDKLKTYLNLNSTVNAMEIKLSDEYYNEIISSGMKVGTYVNTKLSSVLYGSQSIAMDQVVLVQLVRKVA